jgi:anthranilate phosphoribosyltransferase
MSNDTANELVLLLESLSEGRALTADEAERVFDRFMDGSASEIQMAGFLMGLQARGVTAAEVAGGVRALRKAMVSVPFDDPDRLVDTAGTGGGTVTTFNISTAAAFVVAGAGAPVAKHGNRSFTSRSGSADLLEALGVRIDLTPDRMAAVLASAGIVFMFAPILHPAMRHVGPVRRGLGVRTVMNVLGPLTNPAGARRQVLGVADPGLVDLIAGAFIELGHLHAMVVYGEPGMDEVSPLGVTHIAEVRGGTVRRHDLDLRSLGMEPADPRGLAGGSPEENAVIVRRVLDGEAGAARIAVVLNAGAAILTAGLADDWPAAVGAAERSIDSGRARDALSALREATNDPKSS